MVTTKPISPTIAPATDESSVPAVLAEYCQLDGRVRRRSSSMLAALASSPTSAPASGTTQRLDRSHWRRRNRMLHVTAAERKAPPAPRFHPDGTMRATPGRPSIPAMAGKRSPEFIAVPLVAIAVVYAAVLFWAVTADTGLAWTIFILANAAVIVLALVLVARRRGPRSLPAEAETARSSADGVYRPLVLVDAEGAVPRLREEIVRSAAGRPAEAFVVAPALSSRLDWRPGRLRPRVGGARRGGC